MVGFKTSEISAYKAVVVIILIFISAPFIRNWIADVRNKNLARKSKIGKEAN